MDKLKRSLIIILIQVGFVAVILLAYALNITFSKVADVKNAEVRLELATMNTVILGDYNYDATLGELNGYKFGIDIDTEDLSPGMTYFLSSTQNTAKIIPFSVSNGTTLENVADLDICYYVRLYSTANLPLVFTLRENNSITGAYTLYNVKSKVEVETADDYIGQTWYEYTFALPSVEDENGDIVEYSENIFNLTGEKIDCIDYDIIIEWPINTDSGVSSNSSIYIREVDLIELAVVATTVNKLDDETYVLDAESIVVNPETYYSPSIKYIAESEGVYSNDSYMFEVPIDMRGFKPEFENSVVVDDTVRTHIVILDNGVSKLEGAPQDKKYIEYTADIFLPLSDGDDISIDVKNNGDYVDVSESELVMYDIQTGGYSEPIEEYEEQSDLYKGRYVLYKKYSVENKFVLENTDYYEKVIEEIDDDGFVSTVVENNEDSYVFINNSDDLEIEIYTEKNGIKTSVSISDSYLKTEFNYDMYVKVYANFVDVITEEIIEEEIIEEEILEEEIQ